MPSWWARARACSRDGLQLVIWSNLGKLHRQNLAKPCHMWSRPGQSLTEPGQLCSNPGQSCSLESWRVLVLLPAKLGGNGTKDVAGPRCGLEPGQPLVRCGPKPAESGQKFGRIRANYESEKKGWPDLRFYMLVDAGPKSAESGPNLVEVERPAGHARPSQHQRAAGRGGPMRIQ